MTRRAKPDAMERLRLLAVKGWCRRFFSMQEFAEAHRRAVDRLLRERAEVAVRAYSEATLDRAGIVFGDTQERIHLAVLGRRK